MKSHFVLIAALGPVLGFTLAGCAEANKASYETGKVAGKAMEVPHSAIEGVNDAQTGTDKDKTPEADPYGRNQ